MDWCPILCEFSYLAHRVPGTGPGSTVTLSGMKNERVTEQVANLFLKKKVSFCKSHRKEKKLFMLTDWINRQLRIHDRFLMKSMEHSSSMGEFTSLGPRKQGSFDLASHANGAAPFPGSFANTPRKPMQSSNGFRKHHWHCPDKGTAEGQRAWWAGLALMLHQSSDRLREKSTL